MNDPQIAQIYADWQYGYLKNLRESADIFPVILPLPQKRGSISKIEPLFYSMLLLEF